MVPKRRTSDSLVVGELSVRGEAAARAAVDRPEVRMLA